MKRSLPSDRSSQVGTAARRLPSVAMQIGIGLTAAALVWAISSSVLDRAGAKPGTALR